jgi:cytochrome c
MKNYLYRVFLSLPVLVFLGCGDNTPSKHYDGKKLLQEKCASCHNLDIPPYTFEDEKAPPMMAVAFHIVNFVKTNDESQRVLKSKEFVQDYVINPSAEKSFCDKESLESYGVMPSQKGKVNDGELKALTEYIFKHYTQENLLKAQKEKREFDALPAGKKLAIKYKCLGCHRVDKKIIGPSFKDIAKKYSHAKKDEIIKSIQNGSKSKWKNSNGAIMPPFKDIEDEDLEILSNWILTSNI